MPVQFRRDEEPEFSAGAVETDAFEALREGLPIALRVAAVWTIPAALLIAMILSALRRAIIAADRLLHADGDFWSEMWMPAVLLAFFGAIWGALLTWRVSSRASIGAGGVCLLSIAGAAVVAMVGAVTAFVIFTGGVPTMCWIALGAMLAAWIVAAFSLVRVTH